jgi:hypothetical protein
MGYGNSEIVIFATNTVTTFKSSYLQNKLKLHFHTNDTVIYHNDKEQH